MSVTRVVVRLLGKWTGTLQPTRKRIRLTRKGGLGLVVLLPWGGVGLSPGDRTRIGMGVVAIGCSRVRVRLASKVLGLLIIPGASVWLLTVWLIPWKRTWVGVRLLRVARERVRLAAFRGTRKGVRWIAFRGPWVWVWLAGIGGIPAVVVGFIVLVFVAGFGPWRRVRMAWAAGLMAARLGIPWNGMRMLPSVVRKEERVRWALSLRVGGKVQGGGDLVESADRHA